MIDELLFLARAAHSMSLECNPHRASYETVAEYLEKSEEKPSPERDTIVAECVKADRLFELQIYPDTPVGFVYFFGPNLEEVVDEAYEYLRARARG